MGSAHSNFIIIARPRTGSSYLRELLNSHSQLICNYEIFNLLILKKYDLNRLLDNPIKYVDKKFETKNVNIKSVGFKLLDTHIGENSCFLRQNYLNCINKDILKKRKKLISYVNNNSDLSSLARKLNNLLAYLIKSNEIKIIHLKRRNKLEMMLSAKLASLSNSWNSRAGQYQSRPILLDYNDCLRFFEGTIKREGEYGNFFKEHPKIEIFYEDLIKNKKLVLDKIQDFLGVEKQELYSHLKKQNTRKLSESIFNFKELKEKFKNTEYEIYF
jgi:LPS sulfotransferase NodH